MAAVVQNDNLIQGRAYDRYGVGEAKIEAPWPQTVHAEQDAVFQLIDMLGGGGSVG